MPALWLRCADFLPQEVHMSASVKIQKLSDGLQVSVGDVQLMSGLNTIEAFMVLAGLLNDEQREVEFDIEEPDNPSLHLLYEIGQNADRTLAFPKAKKAKVLDGYLKLFRNMKTSFA